MVQYILSALLALLMISVSSNKKSSKISLICVSNSSVSSLKLRLISNFVNLSLTSNLSLLLAVLMPSISSSRLSGLKFLSIALS